MWQWSRTVAEHAAAAYWTSWQQIETEPTIVDPDFQIEATEGDSDNCMAARAPLGSYELVG